MNLANFFNVQSKKNRKLDLGFTLIELIVVVAIFFIVIAAIFTTYTTQHHAAVVQSQVSDMQQNARIAMDFLAKEIRMAGFGMPPYAVNGFSNAITPVINNDTASGNNILNGTDVITIVTGYRQISTLKDAANLDSSTITLVNNASQFNTTTKRYLCIDGADQIDNYQVTEVDSVTNTLTLTPPLRRNYQAGAPVLLVKAITYSISNDGFLTRNENTGGGAQPLAPNIEDLQFAYQLADDSWSNFPSDPTEIRAVRINVLARTVHEDRDWRRGGLGRRPAIEDHPAGGATDGFRRRLLTSVVEVRNLGF